MVIEEQIKWLESDELNRGLYDTLVSESNQTNIYALSWYLDAVSDKWGVLVLGDYKAVMPIPYTIKKGQSIIYQPFFSRQIGVFGIENPSELSEIFLNSIPKKFKLIQFGLSHSANSDFEITSVLHQELNLESEYEDLHRSYSTNAKRQIKKSQKSEIEIKQLGNPQELIELFRETKGSEIGLSEDNFKHLGQLLDAGLNNKKAILLGAYQKKELVAAAYYFVQDHRITYLKGASNDSGRNSGAMYLLMDFVVGKYSGSGRVLDFGGSKIGSIAMFYKKFGAIDSEYYLYERNNLPLILKQVKKVRDKLKSKP